MWPQTHDLHTMSRRRTSILTIIAIVLSAAFGSLLAFSPTSSATGLHPTISAVGAQHPDEDLVTEDVTYSNDDFTINGTIIAPAGDETQRPGVVLVSGSGEGVPRDAYRPHAEAFARAGIVTLIYDTRSAEHGYSFFEASIEDLADDAIAGAQLLQDRPDVDPDRVGLHGHSEGTWTVVAAANRSDEVDFIITSAGSAWSPERTQVWMNKVQLQHAGVADSLLTPLGETLTRHVVDADFFRLAGHDALGPLEQLDQPLLGLFSEYDRSSPPGESLQGYAEALDRGGHQQYQLRVIPGADHEMLPTRDGFDLGIETTNDQHVEFVPQYVDAVTTWVHELDEAQLGRDVDPPPDQPLYSSELAPLAAHESRVVQGLAFAVLILTFASYPVGAIITRVRTGRISHPTRWPARIVSLLGLTLPVITIGYLGYVMTTAALSLGPVVFGRPLPWLLLQLGTVVTLVSGVAMMIQRWRQRSTITTGLTIRFTLLSIGLVTFIMWSAYWGLLTI